MYILQQHVRLWDVSMWGPVDGGRYIRHEQRGPVMAFSVAAFAQLHSRAFFSPQEHLAWEAGSEMYCQSGWFFGVCSGLMGA
jgi:hypothetical protein